jgi:chemotaxis protein methyltransferase CheR
MSAEPQVEQTSREYAFSIRDFECVKKMIYARAGIALADNRQEMVYTRLSKRLRTTGAISFSDYLQRLEINSEDEEWEAFVNALTTNLTSFFREAYHFPILAEHIKKRRSGQLMKLWCSASSTGEEAYSMAMTVVEAFGSFKPPVRILATDIDTNVLATARQGVYSMERLENMAQDKIKRFFLRGSGSRSGFVRVRPELQDLVTFRQFNLLDAVWPLHGPFEAIFCRNVMIYFDKPTQYRILQKFVPLLNCEGLLFMGHSEVFQHAADLIKICDRTVYKPVLKK